MLWNLLLLSMLNQGWASPLDITHKCATMDLLQSAPPMIAPDDVPNNPHKSNKMDRNILCPACSNSQSSDNFILRWGSGISSAEASAVLDAFEYAWEVEVGEMGYDVPDTTDTYLFNVYIGETGSNTPNSYGAAGYFNIDTQGYPYIVLAKTTITNEYYLDSTIAHEFFHALQARTNRYSYDYAGPSAWYWEATANWAECFVYPDDLNMAYFLVGYTFLPQLPVNFFDYPDQWITQEYHQYGAFLFPLHLSEIEANRDIIRDSWQDDSTKTDPMEVLDVYLSDYGTTIEDTWLRHIAHMSVMDYEKGQQYTDILGYYNTMPESSNVIADRVSGSGTNSWRNNVADLEPYRFGHNTIYASNLSLTEARFSVKGDSQGTQSSSAIFGSTVVRKRGNGYTYYPLEFTGVTGVVDITDIRQSDEFYWTIGAWTPMWNTNKIYSETFPYAWSLNSPNSTPEPSTEPSSEPSAEPSIENPDTSNGSVTLDPKGNDGLWGGCSQGPASTQLFWWGIVLGACVQRSTRRKG